MSDAIMLIILSKYGDGTEPLCGCPLHAQAIVQRMIGCQNLRHALVLTHVCHPYVGGITETLIGWPPLRGPQCKE